MGGFTGNRYVGWEDYPDIYMMNAAGTRRIIECWESMSKLEREKYKELKGTIFSLAPTSHGKIVFNLNGSKFIVHDTTQSKIAFSFIKISPKELSTVYGDFSISPDGKEIAFDTQLETEKKRLPYILSDFLSRGAFETSISEIFVMSIEDEKCKRLTYNSLPDGSPCWSKDGKKIYFSRCTDWSIKTDSKEFQSDIFVMDSDGKDQRNLTNSPDISESTPMVSPDDTSIAYITEEERENDKYYTEIWIMNNDGTNKRKIIGIHSYLCGEISWYPKR